MSDAPWFDALFGQIHDRVLGSLALQGGLEFLGGLRARVNKSTKRIEVYSEVGRPRVVIDDTAAYTPALADVDDTIGVHREHTHSAGAITVTLPADADEDLPIGYAESGAQATAQAVSIVAGAGATILNSVSVVTDTDNRVYGYIKTAANTWRAFGGA